MCLLKIQLLFSYIRLDVDIDSKNDSKTELVCVSKTASFCSGKSEAGGVFASPKSWVAAVSLNWSRDYTQLLS